MGIGANRKNNPMQRKTPKPFPMHLCPSCGAKTRSETPCRSPAMANGRCRMHGGKSPGAPMGNSNALRHGLYSAKAISERRELAALIRSMRGLMKEVAGPE